MLSYSIRRLLWAVPTLLGITVITFSIMHLAPGSPAVAGDGAEAGALSAAEYQRLAEHYGWDRPIVVQYLDWLGGLLRLDLGRSLADGQPVIAKIARALPATLFLAFTALVGSLAVSIPLGIISARKAGGFFDSGLGALLSGLYAVPSYVAGVVLILVLGVWADALPFRGMTSDGFATLAPHEKLWDLGKHVALIGFCLAYRPAAFQARFVRANLLEVTQADFMRTALAKGLSRWRALLGHGFRNTLIPLITLTALTLPALLSGAVILEVIFSWPGIGRLLFDSIMQRDYPTIMGLTVLSAVLVQAGTLLADLAYGWVDPRVTYD
jgi:peptide/nickel transport system permease protein